MINKAFSVLYRAALFLICAMSPLHAAEADVQAQQTKISAAYLFHFLQLVKWPEEELANVERPFNLCIVGRDPFGEVIDAVARKKARGRELVIKRYSDIRRFDDCHLLFVSTSLNAHLPELLRVLEGQKVLTVSDIKDFAGAGGMIGFVSVADESESGFRVRFEINLEAARKKGLKINAKLLELATRVRQ